MQGMVERGMFSKYEKTKNLHLLQSGTFQVSLGNCFFLIIEYCEHENCRNRTSQVNKYELLHTYETKHTFLAFFSSEPGGYPHLHLHLSFSIKPVPPFLQGFGDLKTFKKKAVQYLCLLKIRCYLIPFYIP